MLHADVGGDIVASALYAKVNIDCMHDQPLLVGSIEPVMNPFLTQQFYRCGPAGEFYVRTKIGLDAV